ncbi:MAG: hypothetical protein ACJ786_20685 [Catenulispora sp.]
MSRPLALVRRGTSCLALAAAALAVPALPSTAFGATPTASPTANARHHIPDSAIFPDPGAVTFESWAVVGWSFSAPEPMVDTRCFSFPHHHRCAPWMYQPASATRLPITTADGSGPGIEAVRVSHASPGLFDDVEAPGPPIDLTSKRPVDYAFSELPRSTSSTATDQTSHASATAPNVRIRIISAPIAVNTAPTTPAAAAAPKRIRPANAAAIPHPSPCLRAAYLVGKDRRMLAHLRPAADAMGVVLSHPHAACTAMVDYLSQTRA